MKSNLSEREQTMLGLRDGTETGRCWTVEEIAQLFDVSPARIRAIENKARRKLRQIKEARE